MIGVYHEEGDGVSGDLQNDPKNGVLTSDEGEEGEYLHIRPPQATSKLHNKRNASDSANEEIKHLYKRKRRIAEVQGVSEKSSYDGVGPIEVGSKQKPSSQDDSQQKDIPLKESNLPEEEIETLAASDVRRPLSGISESPIQEMERTLVREDTPPEIRLRKQRESTIISKTINAIYMKFYISFVWFNLEKWRKSYVVDVKQKLKGNTVDEIKERNAKRIDIIAAESSDSNSESVKSSLRNSLEKEVTDGFISLNPRDEENADLDKEKWQFDFTNLPPYFPAIDGCRSVNEYEILEKIAEGSYGVVHKAKDKQTEETVALKKLKMEKETEGFPITSLREINTLLKIYIVMDYIEHDLKSFMEEMKKKKEVFLPEEVKCLMLQLLRAVAHLHDNWILHRDLKTSNLLLSNRGILKVGDFGLAREYGSPLKPYSPVVVTLWYRAPEILLGTRKYSTSVDVWSVGCIFSELITMETLFQSKTEVEQINRIFRALGTPNEKMWSGFNKLPAIQHIKVTNYPPGRLWKQFNNKVTYNGMLLLQRFLTYDPAKRIAAREAQDHDYFKEAPLPADPEEFAAMHNADDTCHKTSLIPSPKLQLDYNGGDEDTQEGFFMSLQNSNRAEVSTTFKLRF
ncbi:Cyclin-dependent kinase 11B [Blattella germanica]|nr:Cyclin-dependent kinase 11B [Blattella germanica]